MRGLVVFSRLHSGQKGIIRNIHCADNTRNATKQAGLDWLA